MLTLLVFCTLNIAVSINVQADQKDPRLPVLFSHLLSIPPGIKSLILEKKIWNIWLETKNQSIVKLMKTGQQATQSGQISDALDAYTQVIQQDPNYAEGWNKRALAHYLMNNHEKSLSDIRKTLSLEPNHFGAISGQGLIYIAQNKWSLAKKAFIKALKIHPTMRGPKANLQFIESQGIEEEI